MHPHINIRALLCALSVGVFSACSHAGKDTPEDFQRSVEQFSGKDDVEALVDSLVQPLIASGRNIGMVVGVTTPEGDFIKAYGRRDRETDAPLTKDAIFQVGSITKSFTAVLLAQFEQEGRLKFSDPAKSLIPPGMISDENEFGSVKLGQMPSHTAGMPQEGYTLDLLWGVITYVLDGDNLYRYYKTKTLTDWLINEPFKLNTTRDYSYSNVSITLLGWLLGNIDQKGLRHHYREKILLPLGMTATDITLSHDQIEHLTPGYAGDLPTFVPRHRKIGPWLFDEGIAASGGIHSNAADLLTYCKAAIGRDQTPLQAAFRRTQEVVGPQPDGEMAYSWFVESLPHTKEKYYHIAGIIGGHTSWLGYDLKRGIGVILLQNSINHDDRLSVPLLDRLVALRMKKEEALANSAATINRP